jgi:hypothetical protein
MAKIFGAKQQNRIDANPLHGNQIDSKMQQASTGAYLADCKLWRISKL